MSKSREQLNDYLSKINIQGKRVLDVGVQDKPTRRLTKGEPLLYQTLDIDDKWKPDIVADLNEWWDDEMPPDWENKFDIVFCIEVLEHCWNPIEALTNISQFLTRGGTAYISTPFINPHHDTHDYLRYTNEWYRDALPKLGFSDVKIHERVATVGKGLLQAFYSKEGLRISKIRPEYGNYSYPIGYFVEATK